MILNTRHRRCLGYTQEFLLWKSAIKKVRTAHCLQSGRQQETQKGSQMFLGCLPPGEYLKFGTVRPFPSFTISPLPPLPDLCIANIDELAPYSVHAAGLDQSFPPQSALRTLHDIQLENGFVTSTAAYSCCAKMHFCPASKRSQPQCHTWKLSLCFSCWTILTERQGGRIMWPHRTLMLTSSNISWSGFSSFLGNSVFWAV